MTPMEFKGWLRDHAKLFPGVTKWLISNGQEKTWYAALSGMSASLAQQASQMLYEEPEQIGYTKHPAKILEFANAINSRSYTTAAPTPTMIDGEVVYRCEHCCDTGWVSVYRNETIRCLFGETRQFAGRKTQHAYTCTVACCCEYGRTMPSPQTYDPQRMCRVPPEGLERRRDIVCQWIESYEPANRESAFDEWNDQDKTQPAEGAYYL